MSKVKTIEEMLKEGILIKGDAPQLHQGYLRTGISGLDSILSGNGLKKGRFYLIAGDTNCGKTYLAQLIAKEAIAEDKLVVYIDLEFVYDEIWWRACGVDVSQVLVCRPDAGEQAIDVMVATMNDGVGLVIIDSLAALMPAAEMEEDADYNPMAGRARLQSSKFPKIVSAASKSGAIVLGINQVRSAMKPGQPETYPGGWAQRFYNSALIRIRNGGWLRENDKRIGFKMSVEVRKNKIGAPYQECEVDFRFDGGLDYLGALISEALDNEWISRKGPYYFWGGDKKVMGMNGLRNYFTENPEELERLRNAKNH